MIRPILLVAFALAGSVVAARAQAQGAPPDADDNRFSYNRVDEGYVRLDLRTGQVSLCTRRAAGWSCQVAPDERNALDSEIARLQAENAILKKALLDRGLPLPGGVTSEPGGAKSEPPVARAPDQDLKLPSNADVERVLSFIEKVWRRLIEMMANIQRDLKKT